MSAPVRAQSLRSQSGTNTETVQEAENRRYWDSRKQYGAEGVGERDRQPLYPDGIRFGSYMIFPSGQVQQLFTDNVYRTPEDRISDFAVQVDPRLRFISKFARHALNIDVGGNYRQHMSETNMDVAGGYASAEGAIHINHAHTISFGLLSDYGHEERLATTPTLRANERTPSWHNKVELGITRDAGRLSGTIGAAYNSFDFSDVRSASGVVIDQDARDNEIFSSDFKLNYKFSPGYRVEGRVKGLRLHRDGLDGRSGDAWGWEATAGLSGEVSRILHWRVVAGYGEYLFDAPELGDVGAGLFEFETKWFATQRLTLTALARRSFDISETADGSISTLAQVRAEVEVRTDLLFTAAASYGLSHSLGDGGNEETFNASLEMQYFHSKHIWFNAKIESDYRISGLGLGDVNENKIWFGAKLLF